MSATTSAALAHRKFIYFGCSLPYTEEIGGRTILVTRARPKLEVGAARRVMLAHFLDEVAAVSVDGVVTYAARWACQGGSVDTVLLTSSDEAGARCKFCFATELGELGIGVYRILGSGKRLLYIGSSEAMTARTEYHKRYASWRDRIADITFEQHPTVACARAAETRAIRLEDPEINVLGRERMGAAA